MIKRILSTAAAVFVAGTLSWATNLPLFTTAGSGCNEASQLLNCMNQLVQSINANTGVVAVSTSAFGTPATTTETTLQSITVNSNTLSAPGQSLRARCFGTFGSNTNNKTVKLMLTSTTTQVGAVISSLASAVTGSWNLELLATYAASATNTNWAGTGFVGNALSGTNTFLVSPVVATNSVINWTNAVTVSCSGLQGSSTSAQDITAQELLIEQVK